MTTPFDDLEILAYVPDPDLASPYVDPPFEEWSKMPRWINVQCSVTEKIDGTNAQVYIPVNPAHSVLAGSRTRWIGPRFGRDNFGFGAWVDANAEALRRLGPGRHYGEWWGESIGRRYGIAGRRLSLFNRARFAKSGLPDGLPAEVGLVPELYRGRFDTREINKAIAKLYREGSVAVPGWRGAGKAGPEGVVVRLDGGFSFKLTDEGDAKKGRHLHVEAALGAVSFDVLDQCLFGFSMSGEKWTEAVAPDADEAALRAAAHRVADMIVTADTAFLDARKAADRMMSPDGAL